MKRFNINLDDSAFTKERKPPKPHFQPSVKGQTTSSAEPAPEQPLSYAEYIVQSKCRAAGAPQTDGSSRPLRAGGGAGGAGGSALGQSQAEAPAPVSAGCGQGQDSAAESEAQPDHCDSGAEPPLPGADPKEGGSCQKPDPSLSLASKPLGSGSSIVVSPRQRGNPILKFVRSVPWEFGDVVPDYVLGQTTCALFLSLRYYNLNPNYIHDRLKQLGRTFTLRVLLVQVDVKDPHHALKELARICIMADCTLILAWSPEEAGRYLETYKSYEKKPADLLKEQVEKDYLSKVTDCLTTVKSINKTDAITLLSTFSSVEGIISASKEDLVLCPGLGPQKARRLFDVLHKPFLKSKTKDG
ncbi:DNA excision repair protein ERCC-1 [Salarias fasciatus]|uniref:DNA excision repair protein ERCC-1 n=1 Tax=Salarias fasciatus TaxID=181472 RepID=A0A672HN56_SALFA|nr:DNA excision repair protein ERCC-1 [Salarias fasciatus]